MNTLSKIDSAASATDQLAADLALQFDRSMNVECWPDQYSGDNTAFEAWLRQWEQPSHLLPQAFREWAESDDNPFRNRDLNGDRYHARYTSECGGGSEGVDWEPFGGIVIGRATSGMWWLVPGTETCPEVEDYRDGTEDDED